SGSRGHGRFISMSGYAVASVGRYREAGGAVWVPDIKIGFGGGRGADTTGAGASSWRGDPKTCDPAAPIYEKNANLSAWVMRRTAASAPARGGVDGLIIPSANSAA